MQISANDQIGRIPPTDARAYGARARTSNQSMKINTAAWGTTPEMGSTSGYSAYGLPPGGATLPSLMLA